MVTGDRRGDGARTTGRSSRGRSARAPGWCASGSRAGSAPRRATSRRRATGSARSVLANFGDGAALTRRRRAGRPRRSWPTGGRRPARSRQGSCIVVLATDAPLSSRQLERLAHARRARPRPHRLGRAPRQRRDLRRVQHRDADVAHAGLRTSSTGTCCATRCSNPFFAAAVEATEEAVINCLVAADTVVGHDGHAATAIPLDRLTEIMRAHRLAPT